MNEHHEHPDFLESYYHHTCLIMPEKDVLITDVLGSGWIGCIKRWWYDLFLLSYQTESSRSFYVSPNAMRIERFRQFRKYRHRIHPMSKFRNFWDFLMMVVITLNKVLVRFTSTFFFDKIPISLFYYGAVLELIIIADLFVNLKTGFINIEARRVILNTRETVLNFCTTKLFIHTISAIPLHWFMFLRYGAYVNCGLCKTNRFICILKIISTFSLFRVYETSGYWTKKGYSGYKNHIFKFLRIGTLGLVTMLQYFDLTDVACLMLFIHNGRVVDNSVLGMRAVLRYGVAQDPVPNYKYVIFDLTRILKAYLLFSFGSRVKVFYIDKVIATVAYLIANLFYAWTLLECFSLISRIMYQNSQLITIEDRTLNMIDCRQIPNDLRYKIEQYFDFKPTRLKITEMKNELYRSLPIVLKNEIKLCCYMNLLMRIPMFSEWPLNIIGEVVLLLKKEVFLVNDILAEAHAQGEGMMIVDNGVLAVYSQFYKELGHLIDGDYFGDLSLVTDREMCMSFVVAVTPCTILMLEKLAFRNFMRTYPKLFFELKTNMKRRFNKTSSSSTSSSVAIF